MCMHMCMEFVVNLTSMPGHACFAKRKAHRRRGGTTATILIVTFYSKMGSRSHVKP